MSEIRRLGDILGSGFEKRQGDKRKIEALDNLGISILFADEQFGLPDFYISSTENKPVNIPNYHGNINTIGDYERSVVDKIIHPQDPVICIRGRMGSGKSTTLKYLVENFIEHINCGACAAKGLSCKKLIARIDFKDVIRDLTTEKSIENNSFHESKRDFSPTADKLIGAICKRLWNKASLFIDQKEEFVNFWTYLLKINDEDHDDLVEQVVGELIDEHARIRNADITKDDEMLHREQIKNKIKNANLEWYLKYLVLLWRYLVSERFSNHRECAFVILDNLDSLAPITQAEIVNIMMKVSHQHGPTFILLVRPETFDRHGLNDDLLDGLIHQGPKPFAVINDRLVRFMSNSGSYLAKAPSLDQEEIMLIRRYLSRIIPKIKGRGFREFIEAVSGQSIRNALVLAQGLFQLSIGEMKRKDLSIYFVIRTMVRSGNEQFKARHNVRVTNPFNVDNNIEGRFLTKIRLLKYIAGHGDSCTTPNIRAAFSFFNFPSDQVILDGLNQLLYNECQLVTSNGFDTFHRTKWDDQETISITEIGKGYIDNLIYNIHFIQEVMLDCRVKTNFRIPGSYTDNLCEKISALINFLSEIHETDMDEVSRYAEKSIKIYVKMFQANLISLDIIKHIFESTENLFAFQKKKNLQNKQEYDDVLEEFRELLNTAIENNLKIFGVRD